MRHYLFLLALVLSPSIASAQSLLTNFGVDPNSNFGDFLNTLYAIAIAIAALLAVIKIAIGGVKYMLSEVVTSKADAKADIRGAILGLLIILGAFLILGTINSQFVGGSIGDNLTQLQAQGAGGNATTTPTTHCPYTAVSATGYIWIQTSSPACQIRQFEDDCASPNTITRQYFGAGAGAGQLRCNDPVTGASVTRLTSHFGSMSATEQSNFLTQYQTFIAPWEIANSSTLTTIQTALSVTDVAFAVDLTANGGYPTINNAQPDGMCNQLDQANGGGLNYQMTDYDLSGDGTYDTRVCVRI